MLQSMGSQRTGHDLVNEQQVQKVSASIRNRSCQICVPVREAVCRYVAQLALHVENQLPEF